MFRSTSTTTTKNRTRPHETLSSGYCLQPERKLSGPTSHLFVRYKECIYGTSLLFFLQTKNLISILLDVPARQWKVQQRAGEQRESNTMRRQVWMRMAMLAWRRCAFVLPLQPARETKRSCLFSFCLRGLCHPGQESPAPSRETLQWGGGAVWRGEGGGRILPSLHPGFTKLRHKKGKRKRGKD